jgi:hypothetical protein
MNEFVRMEVGQHVLCINDGTINGQDVFQGDGLTKGVVYTIRCIEEVPEEFYRADPAFYDRLKPPVFIKVAEIVRPDDAGYWMGRFRTLPKLSIEMFGKIKELEPT